MDRARELWITLCLVRDERWQWEDWKDGAIIVSLGGDPLYCVMFDGDIARWIQADDLTAIPEDILEGAKSSNVRDELIQAAYSILRTADTETTA